MTYREKDLYVSRLSYFISQAITSYICYDDIGVVIIDFNNFEMNGYTTNLNYLKTVHELKTKIREKEARSR